jgi:hypothetical protein
MMRALPDDSVDMPDVPYERPQGDKESTLGPTNEAVPQAQGDMKPATLNFLRFRYTADLMYNEA